MSTESEVPSWIRVFTPCNLEGTSSDPTLGMGTIINRQLRAPLASKTTGLTNLQTSRNTLHLTVATVTNYYLQHTEPCCKS
jgi:hypothetical protein